MGVGVAGHVEIDELQGAIGAEQQVGGVRVGMRGADIRAGGRQRRLDRLGPVEQEPRVRRKDVGPLAEEGAQVADRFEHAPAAPERVARADAAEGVDDARHAVAILQPVEGGRAPVRTEAAEQDRALIRREVQRLRREAQRRDCVCGAEGGGGVEQRTGARFGDLEEQARLGTFGWRDAIGRGFHAVIGGRGEAGHRHRVVRNPIPKAGKRGEGVRQGGLGEALGRVLGRAERFHERPPSLSMAAMPSVARIISMSASTWVPKA